MAKYTRSLLFFLIFISFTDCFAQLKSGYTIGVNLSSMRYRLKGENIEPETWAGINFGGLFELPVTRHFSFQSAALFSAKSTGYEIDGGQYSISPIFLEFPLRAVYRIGNETLGISMFAGPYMAIGIDGLVIDPSNTKSMRFGSGYDRDMKPFDMGITAGAGLTIHGLLITAQYGYGMVNLAPVRSDDSEMMTRIVGISLASLFSSGK